MILRRPLLFYLLAVAAFTYLLTFILPAVPIYQGDNTPVFLLNASRMARGELIYRDFFELTWPGTEWLYAAIFKVFAERVWIPAAVLIAMSVGLAWSAVSVSRRLYGAGTRIFLPPTLFLSFAFANALDATHHWFSLLLTMTALATLVEERTMKRLFIAGLLCGAAAGFTQTRGGLVALSFALFLFWEWHHKKLGPNWLIRGETSLAAGFLSACLPFVAVPVVEAGWKPFLDDTLRFPLRYYSYFDRNNLGVYMADVPTFSMPLEIPALAIWLFIHLLTPLVYALFLARYFREARRRPDEPWDRLMLVNFMGLAWFIAIASAPNWFKIASSSLPALILLEYLAGADSRVATLARTILWSAALVTAAALPAITQLDWHGELVTPRGTMALFDSTRYHKFAWLRKHTQPGDSLFEAGDTDVYFPLVLTNPSETPFLTPTDYTRPEQVRQVVAALESEAVRYVIWSPWLDLPDENKKSGDHLRPLRELLRKDYRVVKTFEDGDQVWELRVGCSGFGVRNSALSSSELRTE